MILQASLLTCATEMQADQSNLRRKNEELSQVVHEKSRTLLHTQDLYDKLKHRVMLGQVHDAASDAATDTVQAPPTANRYVDRAGAENQRSTSLPLCQSVQDGLIQNPGGSLDTEMNMGPPPISRSGIVDRTWSGSQVNGPRKCNNCDNPFNLTNMVKGTNQSRLFLPIDSASIVTAHQPHAWDSAIPNPTECQAL